MSIKVLSYNTSWESSQPKPDWNNPNPYEPEARMNKHSWTQNTPWQLMSGKAKIQANLGGH